MVKKKRCCRSCGCKRKPLKKKGAIELSMSTIIVIIIGVILLILGLTFVRGIFTKGTELTENVFGEADAALKNLGTITKELTIAPEKLAIDQGKAKGAYAVIYNSDTKEHSYQVKTVIPPKTKSTSKLECYIKETELAQSEILKIPSGGKKEVKIAIVDSSSPIGYYGCTIELYKDSIKTDSSAIAIEIK